MSIQRILEQSASLYGAQSTKGMKGTNEAKKTKGTDTGLRGSEKSAKGTGAKGTGRTTDTVELGGEGSFRPVSWYEEDVCRYYQDRKPAEHQKEVKTPGSRAAEEREETAKPDISGCELPESYDVLKEYSSFYYHGESISDYELVRLAVASGKMQADEKVPAHLAARQAFQVLVEEEARPRYSWSATKYSEDGMYTFTKREDGGYDMHLLDDVGVGATLEEIAGWICSGIPNRNIETRYLNYLRTMDPELYEAAQNIGREVRNYDMMTEAYNDGLLGDAQHDYDLSLLAMLFEEKGDESFYRQLTAAKKSGDYGWFLENYSPEMSRRLLDIRTEQVERTGGIL